MKVVSLLFLLFFGLGAGAQTMKVSGKVVDLDTKAPLAFVSISVKGTSNGTLTDIDGKFGIEAPNGAVLVFSYLGYETQQVIVPNAPDLLVRLKARSVMLGEVRILPGANPADRIIKQASANRDLNNPERVRSFSYTSYNKTYITSDLAVNDTANTIDTLRMSKAQKLLSRQHLFLTEAVSERSFVYPGKNLEKVIASRTSGFKQSPLVMLASQMQSFSFYNDLVNVMGTNYLNPLSDGSTRKYLFQVEDTLFEKADTVYIISFRPRKNKNFEGLTGTLYINTHGYAVQNVIAEPSNNSDMLSVKVQQKYELYEGKQWFPVQLNTDWIYNSIVIGDSAISASSGPVKSTNNNNKVKAVSRTYISKLSLYPAIDRRAFSEVEVEMDAAADGRDEAFWNQYRKDSLTAKDTKTYQVIDSIGRREGFDRKITAYQALATGKVRWGMVDIDLNTLLTVNKYEGLRAGFGFHTNERLCRWMSAGGYGAWGFGDQALKYGADATFFLWRKRELGLNLSYKNDVVEPAYSVFFEDKAGLTNLETIRNFYVAWMDHVVKYEAMLSFRALKYMRVGLLVNHQVRWGNRAFGFSENGVTFQKDSFAFNEVGVKFKYTHGERFTHMFRSKLPLPGNYPVLFLSVIQGLNTPLAGYPGEFAYTRADLKFHKVFQYRTVGKQTLQLHAGKVWGNVPYTFLYNTRGSLSPELNVSVSNTFETMGLTEFASSEYAAVFFSHNIGKFLKPRKKFNPELELVHNMGWGRLEHPESLIGFNTRTLEEGYFESGLRLYLLRAAFSQMGVGTFYRYGPNSFSDPLKNAAIKLSLSFSL